MEAQLFDIVSPVVGKNLSVGADVAGIHSMRLANIRNKGYCLQLPLHQLRGLLNLTSLLAPI